MENINAHGGKLENRSVEIDAYKEKDGLIPESAIKALEAMPGAIRQDIDWSSNDKQDVKHEIFVPVFGRAWRHDSWQSDQQEWRFTIHGEVRRYGRVDDPTGYYEASYDAENDDWNGRRIRSDGMVNAICRDIDHFNPSESEWIELPFVVPNLPVSTV
mgnify:CR=1 FL=1